jgi:chromosome segregation ATPase
MRTDELDRARERNRVKDLESELEKTKSEAATNRDMFRTMQARAEQAEMKLKAYMDREKEYIAMIDDAAPAMKFALADPTKSTITGLDYTWAQYWIERHGEIIAEFGPVVRHL